MTRNDDPPLVDPVTDRDDRIDGTTRTPDDGEEADEPVVLTLADVTRSFGSEVAVDSLSLSVREGELLTLLGPSGCGKTTTLRLIEGLDRPTAGRITIGGDVVADGAGRFVQPEDRDVGLVFQNFALFPHLSVEENVAFGLREWDPADREARVEELLELVGLTDHREKMPSQLSGGQSQRVALARSLAPEPDVLLLDEPFSNLDVRLRVEMREEVRHILKAAGVTAISVTHDQEEALSISDRVAIMNDGRIEQIGKPEVVFENPESRFVASFLGRASFLPGRVRGDVVETTLGSIPTDQVHGPVDAYDGANIDVLVRPDDLEARPAGDGDPAGEGQTGSTPAGSVDRRSSADGGVATGDLRGDGQIVHRQYTGPSFVYRVELDSGEVVRCSHNHVETFEHDQRVGVDIVADHPLAWYPTT